MDQKHYNMMDWEAIEAIVYADSDRPLDILSVSKKGKSKLIQAFYPDAVNVTAHFTVDGKNKSLKLEKVDEAGFFAEFFNFDYSSYYFKIEYKDRTLDKVYDPYAFKVNLDVSAVKDVIKGKSVKAYKVFGSIKKKYDDIEGYEFTVYAPNSERVSLVGDFNAWKENANLMQADKTLKGVYKLFLPEINDYSQYKYAVKSKGQTIYKNDPFSFGIDSDNSVCVPFPLSSKAAKKSKCPKALELQILEVDLNELFKEYKDSIKVFDYLLNHAKKFNYNTVSFIHLFKSNNPKDIYEILNPYSIDFTNGLTCNALKEIVSKLKKDGILSFIELPLAYSSDCESGLIKFDGTPLFENADDRLGRHNFYKAMLYDYTNPFTNSYLLSCVDYFLNEYDFNGFVCPNTGVILYHDYNKKAGEYVSEEWGSTLNSNGIAFVKEVNRYMHKEYKNAVSIASIYAYYKNVTGKNPESLCFDFCMNTGSSKEILDFLKIDPTFRRDKLDSFLLYTHFTNKDEKYIYPYSYKENTLDFASVYERMPGDKIQKLSNLKMAVIFKHLLYGAQLTNIDIDELKGCDSDIKEIYLRFYTDFRRIYTSHKMRMRNYSEDRPFSYKCIDNQVFTREYFDGDKDYIIVFNFSGDSYLKYNIPVTHAGVYREVFNSDSQLYGGEGIENKKSLQTTENDSNNAHTLTVKLPSLSIMAFEYREFNEKELEAIFLKKKKAMIKFVESEKKKINNKLKEDIEALKTDANTRIKELEELLKPFER